MPRPSRPTTSVITLGLHTLEITWCSICHGVTKVGVLGGAQFGAMGMSYTESMNLIEDLHYDWHDRMDKKLEASN